MSLKRKKRVLAIDDEPAMTEWLKILLEHAGYDVRTALIGTRGEELFKTWRPDSVITDMMLPDVDGIELDDERLTLPHPRAWQRAFVLQPWLDVDPDARLAGRGRVADLRSAATDAVVRR